MASPTKAVGEGANLVLVVVLYALVIGSLLTATVFTSLTIINTTTLSETYGDFVTAVVAFLVTAGTIVGILFLWKYVKPLLSKQGMGGMSA